MKHIHSLQSFLGLATILISLSPGMVRAADVAPEPSAGNVQALPTGPKAPQAKLAHCSADGEFYVSAGRDGRIRYGRTEDGFVLRTRYMCRPEAIALSPDGRFIAAIGKFNGCTSELKVWNAREGSVVCVLESEFGGESLLFSADGLFLASMTQDYTVELWNLGVGLRMRAEMEPRKILHLAFSKKNDGSLVVLSEDGKAKKFSLR